MGLALWNSTAPQLKVKTCWLEMLSTAKRIYFSLVCLYSSWSNSGKQSWIVYNERKWLGQAWDDIALDLNTPQRSLRKYTSNHLSTHFCSLSEFCSWGKPPLPRPAGRKDPPAHSHRSWKSRSTECSTLGAWLLPKECTEVLFYWFHFVANHFSLHTVLARVHAEMIL